MTTEKYKAWSDYRDQGSFTNPYQPGSESWTEYEQAVAEIRNEQQQSSLGDGYE